MTKYTEDILKQLFPIGTVIEYDKGLYEELEKIYIMESLIDTQIYKIVAERQEQKMEKSEKEQNKPIPLKYVSAETDSPIKTPNSILLCSKKDDTLFDIAKNVVLAVENTVKSPEGLEKLTTSKQEETKNKLKELIEYLRIYADWR